MAAGEVVEEQGDVAGGDPGGDAALAARVGAGAAELEADEGGASRRMWGRGGGLSATA